MSVRSAAQASEILAHGLCCTDFRFFRYVLKPVHTDRVRTSTFLASDLSDWKHTVQKY